MNDPTLCITGNVDIDVRDAITGNLISTQRVKNLVVSAGLNLIRDYLNAAATPDIGWFAVGTGTAAVLAANTTLGTEVFRAALTNKVPGTASLTFSYFLPTTAANGFTLTEIGLFNAAAAGSMLARGLIAGIAKNSGITVTFNWTITLAGV